MDWTIDKEFLERHAGLIEHLSIRGISFISVITTQLAYGIGKATTV